MYLEKHTPKQELRMVTGLFLITMFIGLIIVVILYGVIHIFMPKEVKPDQGNISGGYKKLYNNKDLAI